MSAATAPIEVDVPGASGLVRVLAPLVQALSVAAGGTAQGLVRELRASGQAQPWAGRWPALNSEEANP